MSARKRVAAATVALVVVLAVAAPLLVSLFGVGGPAAVHHGALNGFGLATGPSGAHPFGVDAAGRDVLSEVLYGLRSLLWFSLLGSMIALVVGGAIGRVAPRWLGALVEGVFVTVPALLIGLVVAFKCGSGSESLVIAGGVAGIGPSVEWGRSHRVYVPPGYIDALRTLFAAVTRVMSSTIPLVALLGYLAIGQTHASERTEGLHLGELIDQGGQLVLHARSGWWLVVFPGLAITIAGAAFVALSRTLRAAAARSRPAGCSLLSGAMTTLLTAAIAAVLALLVIPSGTHELEIASEASAATTVIDHLPGTVSVLLPGVAIGLLLLLLAQQASATSARRSRVLAAFAARGAAAPVFWLAVLGLYLFADDIGVAPFLHGAGTYQGLTSAPGSWAASLILPWAVLVLAVFLTLAPRLLAPREGALSATAAGITPAANRRRARRALAVAIVEPTASELGLILAAAIQIEYVFGIPGDGQLAIHALRAHDGDALRAVVVGAIVLILALRSVTAALAQRVDLRRRQR